MEALLLTTKELEQLLKVSTKTANKIGIEAGARVQIGRAVRWNAERIKSFINGGNHENK